MALCGACYDGPRGMTGHDTMSLAEPGESVRGRHIFECITCGARWSRHYEGNGSYLWKAKPATPGDAAKGGAAP